MREGERGGGKCTGRCGEGSKGEGGGGAEEEGGGKGCKDSEGGEGGIEAGQGRWGGDGSGGDADAAPHATAANEPHVPSSASHTHLAWYWTPPLAQPT